MERVEPKVRKLDNQSEEHKMKRGLSPVFDSSEPNSKKIVAKNGTNSENIDDFLMDLDEEWTNQLCIPNEELFVLDLSTWKRCKILTVEPFGNKYTKITLEDKRSKEKALCHLFPPWNKIEHIAPGITVSVLASKDHENAGHFVVNANMGFFVTNPDQLVSGTTVVGSLFCQRRGVLQELFRLPDSENKQMVIGTITHSIFQKCILEDSCKTLEDVTKIATNVMKTKKCISLLHATNMSIQEALGLVDPYLREIEIFISNYLRSRLKHTANCHKNRDDSQQLMINAVEDIEENIWCYQLGLKGKIDATVSLCTDEESRKNEKLPLELKTGRASYSFEHVGQLALYEMMMELIGHRVGGGLLLYLRDRKCSRMVANRNMKRDLIMLRNEVAHYFSAWMTPSETMDHYIKEPVPLKLNLPEPINNERACAKCPYNTVCIALLKREHETGIHPRNSGIMLISEESCSHLTNVEIDYFIRWTGLIYLEQQESSMTHTVRNIWNKTPEERCEKGLCIVGLTLLTPVRAIDDLYFHTFALNHPNVDHNEAASNTLSSVPEIFQIGEYVICSTTNRIAVASGHIISRAGHELVVSFERDLSTNYNGETFILDQSSPYQSTGFNLSNLAMLLRKDDLSTRLRRFIVDREIPSFTNGILSKSTMPVAKEILKHLNRHQKQAALKAAATTSYCLLKGLPGTGKTQTIVGLIRLLSALGESILLTSNTHSAVDNVLKRLLPFEDIKFIRLGSIDRIDPALKPYAETVLTENCETPEQLVEVYNQFNFVAVTCQGSGHPMIAQRTFDYCIVDEATQVFQASIIRPLLHSKRFLLVGDPEQLPPVIRSATARTLGASESLFHRLDQEGSYFILPTQYRMNRVITKLANDLTYDGKLVCGNDIVANATLKLPNWHAIRRIYEVERWLMKTISNQIDLSAVILDTGNTHQLNLKCQQMNELRLSSRLVTNVTECANIPETALVVYICLALLRAGVKSETIGVIAPFRAQVELIRVNIQKLSHKQKSTQRPLSTMNSIDLSYTETDKGDIEVNTVDQFQGKDKKVIIYSCTKSFNPTDAVEDSTNEDSDRKPNEILSDKRRLTVAITRAQEKLIIVGDRSSLESYGPFKKLLKVMSKISTFPIIDKKDGFEWNNLFDLLVCLSE
uniref:DNA replication ATP-dependent helicase/nuclease n=1 Tax=Anopheles farauti TaxID=69004 RepID=A0A182QR79_9DIPT